jgi:hypothetical protein
MADWNRETYLMLAFQLAVFVYGELGKGKRLLLN